MWGFPRAKQGENAGKPSEKKTNDQKDIGAFSGGSIHTSPE
jgi:hypothetical protein